jgi:hypothetical protein
MGAIIVYVLLPAFVSASLLAVREVWGRRVLWIASLSIAVIAGVAAFALERPPSETSAAALTVGIVLSLLLATSIVTIGPPRLGRGATLVIATLLAGLSWMPGYIVGCVIADILPVNRCFF